jgi:hypothetical protein
MRLPLDKATQVLRLMVEGMSIRSIERITGVHRDTILRLLLLEAEKINTKLRYSFENLVIERIQVDELHCYVQKRERRVSSEEGDEVGEQYSNTLFGQSSHFQRNTLSGTCSRCRKA